MPGIPNGRTSSKIAPAKITRAVDESGECTKRRYMPVIRARKFSTTNMSCSCLMPLDGRGLTGDCRRIGTSDAIEVIKGMKALRRR